MTPPPPMPQVPQMTPISPDVYQAHWLQASLDRSHLSVLAICYWVWGGFSAMFILFGLGYALMGMLFIFAGSQAQSTGGAEIPPFLGVFMAAFGCGASALALINSALMIYTGFCLHRREHRTLTFIVAGLCCISIPIGTLLGVFTFVVLSRPSVVALYEANRYRSGR